MKKALVFAVFALSFSLMSSVLVPQVHAFVPEWQVTWGGPLFDEAEDVAVDPLTGDIYTVGHTWSFSTSGTSADAFILRFAADGTLIWQRTWGGLSMDYALGVALDPTGDYLYVVGATRSFGLGSRDAFMLKLAVDGTLIWERTWGGPGLSEALQVAVDSKTGGIYVVGNTESFGQGLWDAFILRFAADGTLIWQRTWGGSGNEWAQDVTVGKLGIYVVGDTWSFGQGSYDAFILKFDDVGNLIWERTWGGLGFDFAQGVAAWYKQIFVVGYTENFGVGDYDAFILEVIDGSNPHLLAQKTWGGAGFDWASGITVRSAGFIFVVGGTNSFGPGTPFDNSFALKFKGNSLKLAAEIVWGGSNNDWALDAAFEPKGHFIYVVGSTATPFPPSYLTPGGAVTTAGGALVPTGGTVTQPSAIPGTPSGNVMIPLGSTTFAGVYDVALLKIRDA